MMIKNIGVICLSIALSVSPVCAAGNDRVALDARLCHSAPSSLLKPLPPEWREGGRYIHLCPIYGRNREIVLYIMTARIDIMGKDYQFVEDLIKKKQPISDNSMVLDENMNIIGEFTGNFPYNPPDMLEVTFADWHKNFPYRIDFVAPATDMHGPEHYAPLYWNPGEGKFQDKRP